MPEGRIFLHRNTRWHADAGNLSAIIDRKRIDQLQTRVGSNPGVQVDHGSAVLPQKRVHGCTTSSRRGGYSRRADNLAVCINAPRGTANIILYRPEIGHRAILPEKRVV